MNFKTTIVLIVLLAAAGAWLYFSSDHTAAPPAASAEGSPLLTIDAKDVTKLIVTPRDGAEFELQKVGADWQLTEPTTAAADPFEVDSLIRAFTEAKTRGQIDAGGDNASVTGLATPKFKVQLFTLDKIVKISIGEKSAVGDNLYVQLEGKSQADLIPADLVDKLAKGPDAYRKMNLVTATSDQIKQISITDSTGTTLLQKNGTSWSIVQPQHMPAEDSAVSDLTFALTGLRADKFVDPKEVPPSAVAAPQMTVAFSTDAPVVPPATAPATEPAWTTVLFGSYDDMLKKNVYVKLAGSDAVAKLPSTSMDPFRKRPLDLRDKKAVDLDPDQVSKIVLRTNLPAATQPTAHPAINQTVTIERRKVNPVLGPVLPTTSPTTNAATKPTPSTWIITSKPPSDADDAKITALLAALHPLRADLYLDLNSSTQPTGNYTLTITTTGPGGSPVVDHTLALSDPGHDQPLLGYFNGLTFQTARTLTTTLTGPWNKP